MPTNKSFPIPVGLAFYGINMAASMAHLTGIRRMNKQNLDTMFYSFVDKKLAQLKKSPAITTAICFQTRHKLKYKTRCGASPCDPSCGGFDRVLL